MIIAYGDTWKLDARGAFRTLVVNGRKLHFKLEGEHVYLLKGGKLHSLNNRMLYGILLEIFADADEVEEVMIALL